MSNSFPLPLLPCALTLSFVRERERILAEIPATVVNTASFQLFWLTYFLADYRGARGFTGAFAFVAHKHRLNTRVQAKPIYPSARLKYDEETRIRGASKSRKLTTTRAIIARQTRIARQLCANIK